MKLNSLLGIGGIIVLAVIAFFAIKSFAAPSPTGNGIDIPKNGDFQEITLSFRDYNYYPQVIEVNKDIPVHITADKSISGCFTTFLIPDLGVKHSFLKSRTLEFTPTKTGTFAFSCGMGMGTGKIIVK